MTDASNPRDDDTALGDLDEQARRTEDDAKEAEILPDDDQKWHGSGTICPDLDDQTIAPPG